MSKLNIYIRAFLFIYFILIIYLSSNYGFSFTFMLLNIFLAYVPFEISCIISKVNNKILLLALTFFWLLFYPNAPYLLTDFFHLEYLNIYSVIDTFNFNLREWIEFSILTCGIIFGFFIGIISLFKVLSKLQQTFLKDEGALKTFVLIVLVAVAAGFAIYLGRFPRLHSHYIFTYPSFIIEAIVDSINMESFIFSIAMAVWQIIIIYLLKLFKSEVS